MNLNWKKLAIIVPIIAAIITGVFLLVNTFILSTKDDSPTVHQETKGDKSPAVIGNNAKITYNEASPDLLDRLERANIEKGKQAQIIEELNKKLKETEVALKERGVSQDAIARFEAGDYTEADALFAKEFEEGAEKAANAAYYRGNIKFAQLRFDDALKYYQQAAELEPKNPLYLTWVGFIYNTLGKYKEAIKYYKQALSIDKEVYGERHPYVARDLNNLGDAWDSLGKYEKAIGYYGQALSIWREAYGEKHPHMAASLNNLGGAWLALGKYEKAIGYYEQALSIVREAYGEKHPHVAASLNNLGAAWDSLGKYEKAIGYNEQALSIRQEVYKENHHDVANSLNNLGFALKALGKYEKAREYLSMAYKICVQTLGKNHPSTRTVKDNLDSLPGGG